MNKRQLGVKLKLKEFLKKPDPVTADFFERYPQVAKEIVKCLKQELSE